MPPYTWDPEEGMYYDEGSDDYVTRDEMLRIMHSSVEDTQEKLRTSLSAADVITGTLLVALLSESIKQEAIRQYSLSIGGVERLTSDNAQIILNWIQSQEAYLEDFAAGLEGMSVEAIIARSFQYVSAASSLYERGRTSIATGLGFMEVAWELDPGAEHCDTCLRRSDLGFIPMEDGEPGFPDPEDGIVYPRDGTSICTVNDRCSLTYRNPETGEEFRG